MLHHETSPSPQPHDPFPETGSIIHCLVFISLFVFVLRHVTSSVCHPSFHSPPDLTWPSVLCELCITCHTCLATFIANAQASLPLHPPHLSVFSPSASPPFLSPAILPPVLLILSLCLPLLLPALTPCFQTLPPSLSLSLAHTHRLTHHISHFHQGQAQPRMFTLSLYLSAA